MIKKIHYCWFGGEKNDLVKRCINNWKIKLPDYEIIEWNESNIPQNIKYVNNALSIKKYAFASDYIRVWAILNFGGIYLDTDIEVIKDFSELDLGGAKGFVGFAQEEFVNNAVMGGESGLSIHNEICEYMDILADKFEFETAPRVMTKILNKHGLLKNDLYENIANLKIYPKHVFFPYNPFDPVRPMNNLFFEDIKDDTFTIHHYMASWINDSSITVIKNKLVKLFHLLFK